MTNVTNTVLKFNKPGEVTPAAADSEGVKISYAGADDSRILVIFESEAEKTLTVKKGDSIQGTKDTELILPAGMSAVTLESGMFMNADGFVVITGTDATVNVSAVVLP